eukprot:GHVU01199433.1.p1 GENE.GHVU01199433.1~~GHVU01199433.1.p1  ORF type:complete len:121 (+),score=4.86 GHVU01199433.1:127-489(+)
MHVSRLDRVSGGYRFKAYHFAELGISYYFIHPFIHSSIHQSIHPFMHSMARHRRGAGLMRAMTDLLPGGEDDDPVRELLAERTDRFISNDGDGGLRGEGLRCVSVRGGRPAERERDRRIT